MESTDKRPSHPDEHAREIILVRHGESERNVISKAGKFAATSKDLHAYGILPDHKVQLTADGRLQAQCLGLALRDAVPDAADCHVFFDSGYSRAADTLSIILDQLGVSAEEQRIRRRSHLDLRERDPGFTFNMTVTQVNMYFPWWEEYEKVVGGFYARYPGGESVADVCSRVHMFLNSIRRARRDERVFVVTHGRVMIAFRYWLEKWGAADADKLFQEGEYENCTTFRYLRMPEERCFVRQEETERSITDRYNALLREAKAERDRVAKKSAPGPKEGPGAQGA